MGLLAHWQSPSRSEPSHSYHAQEGSQAFFLYRAARATPRKPDGGRHVEAKAGRARSYGRGAPPSPASVGHNGRGPRTGRKSGSSYSGTATCGRAGASNTTSPPRWIPGKARQVSRDCCRAAGKPRTRRRGVRRHAPGARTLPKAPGEAGRRLHAAGRFSRPERHPGPLRIGAWRRALA